MKTIRRIAPLLLLLLLPSCGLFSGDTKVDAAEILPSLRAVVERHDAYIQADGTLDAFQKETRLLQSKALLDTVTEAATPPKE